MSKTTDMLLALRRCRSVVIVCPEAQRPEINEWLRANRPDLRVEFADREDKASVPLALPEIIDEAHTLKRWNR